MFILDLMESMQCLETIKYESVYVKSVLKYTQHSLFLRFLFFSDKNKIVGHTVFQILEMDQSLFRAISQGQKYRTLLYMSNCYRLSDIFAQEMLTHVSVFMLICE